VADSTLSPRLFVSYSRRDSERALALVADLRRQGFRVFLDTADIDPGENFVNRLSRELRRSDAIVALISEDYSASRWAQAELYYAVALRLLTIPVLLPPASIASLDPPLVRLLQDIQLVTLPSAEFSELLRRARKRRRSQVAGLILAIGSSLLFIALLGWWVVAHLNGLDLAARRNQVLSEVTQAKAVLQTSRVDGLSSSLSGDKALIGELLLVANDPAQSDVGRFNAMALSGRLLKGHREFRWYVKGLDLYNISIQGSPLLETSFLGGNWQGVKFQDLTFSGVVWADQKSGMSNVVFEKVRFNGSELGAVNAVNVSFLNSKFHGSSVDTTNFAKVSFVTSRPVEKGTPTITPDYTLFERSTLVSHRTPPEPGVMDLSEPEDDVIFDGVVFVDSRLEGWFKPEWFRRSSFERCLLPPSLSKEALEKQGNTVD
jgi:uncharacterized protein YjbI with pentapeptide repeats